MWRSFLCRIGWHRWTEWAKPENIDITHAQQFRICMTCKRQDRHIF